MSKHLFYLPQNYCSSFAVIYSYLTYDFYTTCLCIAKCKIYIGKSKVLYCVLVFMGNCMPDCSIFSFATIFFVVTFVESHLLCCSHRWKAVSAESFFFFLSYIVSALLQQCSTVESTIPQAANMKGLIVCTVNLT